MITKTFDSRTEGGRFLVHGNKELHVDLYVNMGGYNSDKALREVNFTFTSKEKVRDMIEVLTDVLGRMEDDKASV